MKHTTTLACILAVAGIANAQNRAPEQAPTTRPAVMRPGKLRQGGYLGLYVSEVLEAGKSHVVITGVVPGSEADKVGFKKGDRVLETRTKPHRRMRMPGHKVVENGDDFIQGLWSSTGAAKGVSTVTVLRDGKKVEIPAGMPELDVFPRVGDKAPGFSLKSSDGKTEFSLSKLLAKKKPVVLVFGSYT